MTENEVARFFALVMQNISDFVKIKLLVFFFEPEHVLIADQVFEYFFFFFHPLFSRFLKNFDNFL
jgi:hypothetical protein